LNRQIETALAHNHDLRRAYANLLTARALFDQRQWERLPNVDVNLDHTRGIQQQGAASDPERVASRPWRAALDVQWEIDLFGRLAHLSQSAQEEVENAVTQLVEQQRQLASLMQAAQHAQAALEIADQRYRAGAGSYQSVLENQRALFQLRHQVTDVETLSSVHVVTLYKALGWGKEAMNG